MSQAFEKAVITHCAPTLAGHKCGSLFHYRAPQDKEMQACVAEMNRLLKDKGVCVRLLKACPEGCLVYLYRPALLQARLSCLDIQAFLHTYGYASFATDACLERLSQRIRCGEDFPHEVGIFLDYPLEDVQGFIQHRGGGYRCAGCWKAYGNAAAAQKTFALYRKCKRVYMDCYHRGFHVTRLTVAV